MLGIEEEEKPFRNRTYLSCVDIGRDEFGSYIHVVYDSYLFTSEGLINYSNDDVTNDPYVRDMMKPLRQSMDSIPRALADMIVIGNMIRRKDGSELLKIIKLTSTDVTMEYILPKSRQGELLIEKDIEKITSEIKDFLQ